MIFLFKKYVFEMKLYLDWKGCIGTISALLWNIFENMWNSQWTFEIFVFCTM